MKLKIKNFFLGTITLLPSCFLISGVRSGQVLDYGVLEKWLSLSYVDFGKVNGKGKVSINSKRLDETGYFGYYFYHKEKTDELSNGDSVTFIMNLSDKSPTFSAYYFLKYGWKYWQDKHYKIIRASKTIKIKGLKNLISSSKLIKSSFKASGNNGSGTLSIKDGISFPSQVEIKYAISKGDKPRPIDYSSTPPSTLLNGDSVYIKFLVKRNYRTTHMLPEDFKNTIVFPIIGLPKKDIVVSSLKASSFEAWGNNDGSGTLSIKDNISLPSQVEAAYAVSDGAEPQSTDYSSTPPSTLSKDDSVYIKFAVKSDHASTHKLPDDFRNLIVFPVSELKTEINRSNLVLSSFETKGHNGSGTLSIKDGIFLPSQVEVAYAVSDGGEPQSADYSSTPPSKLLNGNSVYIKFALKSEHTSTHKLHKDFKRPIVFSVSGLKIRINTSNLVLSSFETKGHNGSGTLSKKDDISLPSQVEIKYAISKGDKQKSIDYSSTTPSTLSNGNSVYIKFAVKSKHALTHKLPEDFRNTIVFPIIGLPKKYVVVSNLKASSFEVSGSNGAGSLSIKEDVVFPSQVEVAYAVSDGDEPQSADYSSTPPSKLLNGNSVYIKYAVKSKHALTHKLPEDFRNTIVFPIIGLPKKDVVVSNLKASSFEASGSNGAGSLSININLPMQVEATYATSTSLVDDATSLSYSSAVPTSSLSKGDIVYIKFTIKDENSSTHKFPSKFTNPIIFQVPQLKIKIDTTKLVIDSFETNGNDGAGSLSIKEDVILPMQVKTTYATSSSLVENQSYLNYSSSIPTSSLSNGDIIYIKFSIKDENSVTHKFPSNFINPIIFQVPELKKVIKTKTSKKTLSKGKIAGIAIGSILSVGIIGGILAIKFLKIDVKRFFKKNKN